MGATFHSSDPGIRLDNDPSPPPAYVMPASPRPVPVTRHVVLFVLTLITTTLAGSFFYGSYVTELGNVTPDISTASLLLHGLWYSGGVLAILGAHEFGHYFACRYYGVDASLPYFIPLWLPWVPMPGTLGAVIRIRQPIASKVQFFDIGIAGPIAGFVVILPVLAFGMSQSAIVTLPADFVGVQFGEPLLFRMAAQAFHGTIAEGQTLNVHPAAWAAWFGLLATALNLCPVSQLDGGHISYAVFGRASSAITLIVTAGMIGLTIYSGAYFLWTVLVVAMLYFMGRHHPRATDESEPLGAARLWLAAFAAGMLVLSFTPVPLIQG